jgi:hypothetical protein
MATAGLRYGSLDQQQLLIADARAETHAQDREIDSAR